jgi:hypothetical protein
MAEIITCPNVSHRRGEVHASRRQARRFRATVCPQKGCLTGAADVFALLNMKTNAFVFLLMAGLAGLVAGCVSTVNNEHQFGIPFIKDDADAVYEASVVTVLQAARDVIKENGTLVKDNSVNNSLQATIKDTTVYIRVDEVDPVKPESHLYVQARTAGGAADSTLAHEVDKRIALKLQAHAN